LLAAKIAAIDPAAPAPMTTTRDIDSCQLTAISCQLGGRLAASSNDWNETCQS
jgi:hypothetical protein